MKAQNEQEALIHTGLAIKAWGEADDDSVQICGSNDWSTPPENWEAIDNIEDIINFCYLRIHEPIVPPEISATMVGKIFRNRKTRAICQIVTQEEGRFLLIHGGDIEDYSAADLQRFWIEVKPSPTLHEDP